MRSGALLTRFVLAAVLMAVCGCQSPNGLVRKSKNEQMLIDQQVARANLLFKAGDYAGAESILSPLAAEKTVNQPLHQYELSSVYLLSGKKEEAHRSLMATHESIEGFFDKKMEGKAASFWGRESKKVFKGEPYERGTLYTLLALSFLEQGNADNALAALKTGMLADSDTENQSFKEDYALLQFLAAKCYEIRNEPEMRDQMLDRCFTSLMGMEAISAAYTTQLVREYDRRAAADSLTKPPSIILTRLCVLASEEKLTLWLMANGQEETHAQAIAAWAKQSTSDFDPMKFNTLVLLWNGEGPDMSRAGEYGEKRIIHPGVRPDSTVCSVLVDKSDYDCACGFGDVSFQATTRGGRLMDDVLSKQAAFKGGMDAGAGVMWELSQQDYGNGAVNLGMMVAAGLFKATAAATKTEADIRHWQNLPCGFEMLALDLPPGTHDMCVRHWKSATPIVDQQHSLDTSADALLTVVHVHPPAVSSEQIQGPFVLKNREKLIFMASRTSDIPVDINHDGELNIDERNAAYFQIKKRFDSDKDGMLSSYEINNVWQDTKNRFEAEMVKKTSNQLVKK